MKDSEFIELLNLYLDHEISAVDAARLENEVQGNAARRRIYQQYCRMQKACKVLAVDFETEPSVASNVIPFEPAADVQAPARKARASGLYAWGTVAAAACVALALFSRSGNSTAGSSPVDMSQSGPVAVAAPVETAAPAAQSLLLATQTQEADARFAWMNEVQLTPIQSQQVASDTLRFDAKTQPTQPGVYNSAQPLEVDEHMSAFRFQK